MNRAFWDVFGEDYTVNCLAWEHFHGNPVVPACGGSWKKRWTANPDVLDLGDQRLLYYRGHGCLPSAPGNHDRIGAARIGRLDRTGLAISELNDGLPVIDVGSGDDFDAGHVLDPASIVFGGRVFLYYSAISADGAESVGLAVSDDGVCFEKCGRVYGGRAPEVVVSGDGVLLLYQRRVSGPGSPYELHLASSTDGVHFEDVQDSPVFEGEFGSWDAMSVVTCRVGCSDGWYHMLYGGSAVRADEPELFGLARSRDLLTWERHPGNPIFGCGPKGSPDGGAIWFPALVEGEDGWFLLYEGSRGRYSWDLSSQICMSWIPRPTSPR